MVVAVGGGWIGRVKEVVSSEGGLLLLLRRVGKVCASIGRGHQVVSLQAGTLEQRETVLDGAGEGGSRQTRHLCNNLHQYISQVNKVISLISVDLLLVSNSLTRKPSRIVSL